MRLQLDPSIDELAEGFIRSFVGRLLRLTAGARYRSRRLWRARQTKAMALESLARAMGRARGSISTTDLLALDRIRNPILLQIACNMTREARLASVTNSPFADCCRTRHPATASGGLQTLQEEKAQNTARTVIRRGRSSGT